MNIIIVGCGKVGEALAEQLNENGNDITVVDIDSERVEYIVNKHDVLGVVGNGATHATLEEARFEDADLLIAVTGSDELNLLCCLIAQKAGNCQVIARVRNREVVRSVHSYAVCYVGVFVVSLLLLTLDDTDLITTFTAVTATLNNIGPGLEMVGPTANYAFFSVPAKLVLIFDMLAGRLELLPLLLFRPSTWKR